MARGRQIAALLLGMAGVAQAQPALTEPAEFPSARPGPRAVQSGVGCFHLASGTITPGDVDWVQILMPRTTTQTIVDVDFPATGGGSALLASVIAGTTAFNISDGNGPRDAFCGLSATTIPVGSTKDSAASLGATVRNVVMNIGITGAADSGFVGAHSETFNYDVWVYALTVPCTMDSDCNDGVACTVDACDTTSGDCFNDVDDAACDNGLFCDGEEYCDAVRGCRAGLGPDCDDGVACTFDDCDPVNDQCMNLPDDGFCDNETFCDGVEWCDPAFDCQAGDPPACDDGVECTVDRCDTVGDACAHDVDDAFCDDGLYCTGEESCDSVRDCVPGTLPVCDDGVPCTVDTCDPEFDDCLFMPNDAACDNGVFCDGDEWCDAVEGCVAGDEQCPDQLCRENDDRCVDCLGDSDCDDGDFCNGAESCDGEGLCVDGTPPCPPELVCNPDKRRCESGAFALDIKPSVCPNRVTTVGQGYLTMAVAGRPGADVRNIDAESLRLVRVDGVGGSVMPHEGPPGPHTLVQDVATPFDGAAGGCHTAAGDGRVDLVLHFAVQTIVAGLELDQVPSESSVEVQLTGRLTDGSTLGASDVIVVVHPGRRR